jgi:hypothetical protein
MPDSQQQPFALTGPWDHERARAYLEKAAIPLRLAVMAPSGWPVIVSLWFIWHEDALWCATAQSAKIVSHIATHAQCGFEVAADQPPYRGLRGQARVTIHGDRGAEILPLLIDRYLASRESRLARWLLSRVDEEVALRLEPVRCHSWDFTARMKPEAR